MVELEVKKNRNKREDSSRTTQLTERREKCYKNAEGEDNKGALPTTPICIRDGWWKHGSTAQAASMLWLICRVTDRPEED